MKNVRVLKRGEAKTADLTAALDSLGVAPGDDFAICALVTLLDKPAKGKARRSDPATSHKAALDNMPRAGSQRRRLLDTIYLAGNFGLTSEEAANETGIAHRSVTPRLAELKTAGWLVPTGETRAGSLGSDQEILVLTDEAKRIYKHDELPSAEWPRDLTNGDGE